MLKRWVASRTAMKTGSCGCAGLRGAVPGCLPLLEILAALFARNALVVGEVVGLAHEGVDGADGVAARLGKGDEGVVEILGFAFGDGPAIAYASSSVIACGISCVKQPSLLILPRRRNGRNLPLTARSAKLQLSPL